MNKVMISNREMTSMEFKRMNAGFDENTLDNQVQVQSSDRFGFVATDEDSFIGCSSGLAYKNAHTYSGWFYLTDLFVEKAYRAQGIGAQLLTALEKEIISIGVQKIWTWTAGYEAPQFYLKQGYKIFTEMEHWYSDGSSRVGLIKNLKIS